jgi:hypothetical protein
MKLYDLFIFAQWMRCVLGASYAIDKGCCKFHSDEHSPWTLILTPQPTPARAQFTKGKTFDATQAIGHATREALEIVDVAYDTLVRHSDDQNVRTLCETFFGTDSAKLADAISTYASRSIISI